MDKGDVIVIGGGPAGYMAAIRASQLGGKVTLVEEKNLGGICVNRGCIPTKFLLHTVDIYQSIKDAGQYGISVAETNLDLSKMQAGKNKVISTLVSGVEGLLRRNNVEVISGRAKLTQSKQIEIDSGQGKKQTIQADKVIIATGSKPIVLPIPGADSPDVMGAEDMLSLDRLPKSLVMVGGGVIGVEMATILAKLGCKVSIVEMMPHILPTQDAELVVILDQALRGDGVEIYCGAQVTRIEDTKGGKLVTFSDSNKVEKKLEAEAAAVCVGYKPNIEGLGLDECGVAIERGRIQVNERMQASIPDIYAAGDVVGGMMLAYVSFAEGRVAAENVMGKDSKINYQAVPQCIFTLPEVASVGLTEEEAVVRGYQLRIGRFPFVGNGMAKILGEQRGLVKIITDQDYGQILGVHIVGPRATSLIPEAALAMKLEATAQDIIATMHAHPTLSEAIWEAALDVTGEAIHFHSRRR